MKGLVSFAVVLVFAALLAHVTQTRLGAEKETYSAKSVAIALEKRYYADIDVKNAFRQVLASATGAGCEEKTADAARKLAMLEAFAEKAYGDKGVQIDLWLGEAGKTAVAELKKKMLGESAALKPPGALDFGVNVLDWRGEPVPIAASSLACDPASGKVFVSRNTALVPEQFFLNPVFGISVYFQDVAAVALIGEGFHA